NGCSNLTEINLPSSISEIGAGAFHGCSNLGHITLSSEGALSSFSSSFNSCKDNAEIEFKDVESIPAESFNGCAWLNASIIIPTTVTKIGANAFNGCSQLAEINLPSNVSNIENAAFYGCSNLEHITLSSEEALSSFRSSFDSCKDNAKIEIKDVKSIPVESFKGCSWLKEVSIDIPTTVTNIGDNAFEGCSGLTELYIPASVVNIGNCVFDNCTNLSKIDVDSNNKIYKSLDGFLLSKDSSKLIRCLEGKKGSVKLPDNVDSISSYAFSGCKKLSSVTMNENLKTISEYAFKNCTGLTSINIPSSVTEIGDGVFSGCTNITSATLNNSDVLEKFKSIFMNCSNLNTVIIGNSVDTIPDNTFNGWSNLNSISIGDNVVLIGDSAFSDCVKLSTVTIPSKVSLIYRSAFSGCKELTNVNIFGDLNYVGQEAFADCTKLNNFTYQGTRAPLYDDPGKNVFSNCPLLEKVSVPKDYKGSTFCGHQTTKGKSAKEKFDENIGWWLSSIG
ncbi:MAG: leucine-rich repeat domain-containing protein, partial [Candidatus Riflebacteria bacterium]|nr:leucine-rich repeat domain-containing protein [Candidatus Riflebacteria bacterium]